MKRKILRSPDFLSLAVMIGLGGPLRCGEERSMEVATRAATPSEQCKDAGESYIGVVLIPIEEALRAQLKLPANMGFVVGDVMEGSPAKRAGIEKYDLILAVSGEAVKTAEDLSKAIQKAAGEEIALSIIHGGEKKKISVRPERRPRVGEESQKDPVQSTTRKPLEAYHFLQPGIIIKETRPVDLPDGVSVTVTKEGRKPASIRISRGGKDWEFREMKLEGLPDDLRAPVEIWLAAPLAPRDRGQVQIDPRANYEEVRGTPQLLNTIPFLSALDFIQRNQPIPPRTMGGERLDALEKRMDESLGEIKAKLERLEKALEASGRPTDARR